MDWSVVGKCIWIFWWYLIIFVGVNYYYLEGFVVLVLENESLGCNCYGINCKID